jgi:Fe-S-cluster containining protein
MSKCLNNQEKCKSACCRYFVFNCKIDEEMIKYYNMHENTYAKDNQVFILNKCKNLGEDGKCMIYKTRPKICREGYSKRKTGVDYPEKCVFKR